MSSSFVGAGDRLGADRERDDVDDRDDGEGHEADPEPVHDSPHRAGGHHHRRMTDVLTRIGLRRMTPRNPSEPHRVATPLELLFDLVFVVAVAQASQNLHHLISDDHVGQGVAVVPDGVLRDLVGVDELHVVRVRLRHRRLALPGHDDRADGGRARARRRRARGHGRLRLPHGDVGLRDHAARDGRAVAAGRGIRPRGAADGAAIRRSASRVVQVLWLARMYLLDEAWQFWTFFVLVAAELAVPVWAESHRRTSWHPHHIAERFGLFTLLLLGESLLASANAMIDALGEGEHIPELLALAACGIVVTAGIWWLYFAREQHGRLATPAIRVHVRLPALPDLRGRRRRLGRRRGRDRLDHRAHRDLARDRGARPHDPDRAVRAERVGDPAAADAVAVGVGVRRRRRDPDRGERAAAGGRVCRLGAAAGRRSSWCSKWTPRSAGSIAEPVRTI